MGASRRSMPATIAVVVVLAAAACTTSGTDTSGAADGTGAGEIFLEPEDSDGPDPFTASVANDLPKAVAATPNPTPTDDRGAGEIPSESGTTPGLYGGTQDQATCDTAKLVEFLEGNPDKRAAWAGVLDVPEDAIGDYIDGLAAVVLRNDTRVTNHGFKDGRATARQSVLEAGTAVLVDTAGIPRVRCACGNPLVEPVPVSTGPDYTGDPWPGFDAVLIVVIAPGPPVTSLVVVDIVDGGTFEVPVSSSTPPEPTPTTTTTTGSPPPPGGATQSYDDCARRYGLLVRDLTLAGIEPDPAWPAQAEEAAELARGGDLDGAEAVICGTVEEMQAAIDAAGGS